MELKRLLFYVILLFINLIIKVELRQAATDNVVLKSIKGQDGDVIDCVDIYHQPAFDHPLLRDHTIKMVPSYYPEGANDNFDPIIQIWQSKGECPEGTIPIRRTKHGAISIKKKSRNIIRLYFEGSAVSSDAVDEPRHEYAVTQSSTGNYYGAMSTISVWQPYVEGSGEFSLSQIWVAGGSGSNTNTIEVGWIVCPLLYGDNLTRLFIYWTSDNYQNTGCFDLQCSGFVQIDSSMAIGGAITTTNHPEIILLVWKDEDQDVWWLQYNGTVLGYWPTAIFTVLNDTSTLVEWGGEIINSNTNGIHTATDMGSGSFAQAGLGRASYFRNLLVVNDNNTLIPPPTDTFSWASNPTCYNITAGENGDWGNYFYYGGPGRNPNCP
ncbi:OLC1v1004774C1 [Oldenlandia corymbosa var. corymbosa]|uniref:OLC1v1004774C1 n=1 Tax=Oldenlandia corymbosa var. corymbosa TaxID=529605 RepID=A0AAV1DFI3_OLDCO|nr:OLC1v1004774C1 [Oldenlandia corymbosa var. corymbosa]